MKPFVIWLTGLSGSGKSTISLALSEKLNDLKIKNEILDGDVYRTVLSPRDGYTDKERDEFRRKVIYVANILKRNDIVCIIPLLSSTRVVRDEARKQLNDFIEVYVKCPLSECEKRDPKGHFKRVRKGELKNFVGIDLEYEEPLNPEVVVETDQLSVNDSVQKILDKIKELDYL